MKVTGVAVLVFAILLPRGLNGQSAFQTRLNAACWSGNVDSVKALPLEKVQRSGGVYGGRAAREPEGADVSYADENGLTPLHIAAFKGHVNVMQYLLEKGADADAATFNGLTALHLAAQEGHKSAVEMLLAHDAESDARTGAGQTSFQLALQSDRKDVVQFLADLQMHDKIPKVFNIRDKNENTLLHFAAAKKDVALLRNLLKQSLDVDAKNVYGNTPLHIAAGNGAAEIAAELLDNEAEINSRNLNGETPLHKAVSSGNISMARFLLSRGAEGDGRTSSGMTPLHYAAETGNVELFTLLDERDPSVLKENESILHRAIASGNLQLVRRCIASNHDVNSQDKGEQWALMAALNVGSQEIVDALLAAGARVDVADGANRTPLHVACVTGNLASVRALMEKGANVNAEAERDVTPLHLAALYGRIEVVRALLAAKAEVNARTGSKGSILGAALLMAAQGVLNKNRPGMVSFGDEAMLELKMERAINEAGQTPLHLATRGEHDDIVALLLGKGADPKAKTERGNSTLHLAASQGSSSLVKALLPTNLEAITEENNQDSTVFDMLFARRKWEDITSICEIVKQNPSLIGTIVENQVPILHFAALVGDEELVKNLLRAGADVNQVHLMPPLHFAVFNGKASMAKLLLDSGANVETRSNNGSTALHAAAASGNVDLVKQFLEADRTALDVQNDDDQTPIMNAAESGCVECVKYLATEGADLGKTDEAGEGVIHYASRSGNTDMMKYLVEERHVALNPSNKVGMTPLHMVCAGGNIPLVNYLLGSGADVNATTQDGLSPLHYAATGGHIEVISALVGSGAKHLDASYALWDKTWGGAIRAAKPWGSLGLIGAIVHAAGGNKSQFWKPIHLAARSGREQAVRVLMQNGEATSSVTSDKLSPLHLACKSGNVPLIELLLQDSTALSTAGGLSLAERAYFEDYYGNLVHYAVTPACNINAADENGWTPLHWAYFFEHEKAVSVLKLAGADITRKTTSEVKVTEEVVIKDGLVPEDLAGLLGSTLALYRGSEDFNLGEERQYMLWR